MPQNEQSELEKLFPKAEQTVFDPNQEAEPSSEKDDEEIPAELKNRHLRRLEAKLQAEREANIAMAARIEALSEVEKFRSDTSASEWEENLTRIYGTDSPEKAEATRLLIEGIKRANAETAERVREEMLQELASQEGEVEQEVATLESYIEQIEDEYGVDLSSSREGRERRAEYLDLMERLSPKTRSGDIVEYADPFEVWDIFSARQTPSKAKEFASRSMTPSRGSVNESDDRNATAKWLMENGII